MYLGKTSLFGQVCTNWFSLGKSGSIWAKLVVFGKNGCILVKWFYLGKLVLFGKIFSICSKVVLFGKGGSFWTKIFVFRQNDSIRANWFYLGSTEYILAKVVVFGYMWL